MRPSHAPLTLTSRRLTHRCHSHYDMMKDSATADGTSMKPVPVARDGAQPFPPVPSCVGSRLNCLLRRQLPLRGGGPADGEEAAEHHHRPEG